MECRSLQCQEHPVIGSLVTAEGLREEWRKLGKNGGKAGGWGEGLMVNGKETKYVSFSSNTNYCNTACKKCASITKNYSAVHYTTQHKALQYTIHFCARQYSRV